MSNYYGEPEFKCIADSHHLKFSGSMGFNSYPKVLEKIYFLSEKNNVKYIILDFSMIERIINCEMLPIIAAVIDYRENRKTNFKLILPKNDYWKKLFLNTNYAHYIEPKSFDRTNLDSLSNFPATVFKGDDLRSQNVSDIMNIILQTITKISRESFRHLEWALNEITDNVLLHSESQIGGLIQMNQFPKKKIFEFTVADFGVGIPRTLQRAYKFQSPEQALELAIKEGVTGNKTKGQGNGLFGTYELCARSNGAFKIHSGHGILLYASEKLRLKNVTENFRGTYINAQIHCDRPDLLDEILQFDGKKHSSTDLIENKFETSEDNIIHFKLIDNTKSTGSRESGLRVRRTIRNLFEMDRKKKISIDMEGIAIMSSSFADEVFGKLVKEIGIVRFTQSFTMINISKINENLIDRAISQRMSFKE